MNMLESDDEWYGFEINYDPWINEWGCELIMCVLTEQFNDVKIIEGESCWMWSQS